MMTDDEDITESGLARLHKKCVETSTVIFKFLHTERVPENVAFFALCMTLARLAHAMDLSPEYVQRYVGTFHASLIQGVSTTEPKPKLDNKLN